MTITTLFGVDSLWCRCGILLGCVLVSALGASRVYAGQTPVDPCGGVKSSDAAKMLKVPLADIVGPKSFKSFTCFYRSRHDPYLTLSFNIYVAASAAKAAHALAAVKEGLTFLSPIKSLSKLGDEAYLAPDPRVRRLLMRKGRIWLDVVTPGDGATQRRIAKIVLAHLP